jgi:hypothetical protein
MTNVETTTPDKTAAVAAQTAHVAPEKASLKKGATRQHGAPKGRTAANGAKTGKTKAAKAQAAEPKKAAKAGKTGKKAAKPASAPRAESKGAKILAMIQRPKGATLAEIMKVHRLAGTQRPGIHLHRCEEAGDQDRVYEERGRGTASQERQVDIPLARLSRRRVQRSGGGSASGQSSLASIC